MQARSISRALSHPIDLEPVLAIANRALRWWFGELTALLPHRLRRQLSLWQKMPSILEVGRSSVRLVDGIDNAVLIDQKGTPGSDDIWIEIAGHAQKGRVPARMIILLEQDMVITREVTLPLAAQKTLSAIVRHHIPKLVPMAPTEIISRHGVVRRMIDDKTMTVRVTLVKRTTVVGLLGRADQAGFMIPRIAVKEPSGNHVLVWKTDTSDSLQLAQRMMKHGKICVAIILLLLAASVQIVRTYVLDRDLSRDVALIQMQAADVITLGKELDRQSEQAKFLYQRAQEVSAGVVMADLTRLLPTDVSLSQFVYQGSVVVCSGQARDAASLVGLIEGSSTFTKPRFTSATTLSVDGTRQAFDVTFIVRQDVSSP